MENRNRINLYLVTLSLSLAMVTMGLTSGWPTLALSRFENNQTNVDIDKLETSTVLLLIPIGFAVGSVVCGYIADKLGRRVTILASALPFTAGSIIVGYATRVAYLLMFKFLGPPMYYDKGYYLDDWIYSSFCILFAVKAWQVCVTAFLWNCGSGMISTVINYYMTEIADKDVRGQLSVIIGLMFKLGMLFAFTVGPFLSYETLNYIMFALPLLYFVTCWWIPETPYFFLRNNNLEGARKSLRKMRGYKDEKVLEDELLTLQANVKNEMRHSSSVKELFVGVQYRKAIIIATGLKLTVMMTGGAVTKQYLSLIIKETKLDIKETLVPVIYGSITFFASLMTSQVVDRMGRRPLLVYSYFGTGASLFAVGLYFFFQEVINVSSATLTTIGFIPFAGIILANVISTLGFSSLLYIIPTEIFPINVKVIAITCLSLLGSALGSLISFLYQRVKDSCGLTTVFWIFAGFSFVGSVFSYFFVIETKGKCLSVIQKELQGVDHDAGADDLMLVRKKLEKLASNDEAKEGTEMEELKKKEIV